MKKIKEKINISEWIYNNTEDTDTLIEMGAGFFNRLENAHPNVNQKIGIEIYGPYLKHAKYTDCIMIHGSVLDYHELLKGYNLDTALIVDFLEHLEYDVALRFFDSLKQDFRKILLMVPVGDFPHNKDITGKGGHQYQTHRSSWYETDILKLGLQENVISTLYYDKLRNIKPTDNFDTGCYFGIWRKNV